MRAHSTVNKKASIIVYKPQSSPQPSALSNTMTASHTGHKGRNARRRRILPKTRVRTLQEGSQSVHCYRGLDILSPRELPAPSDREQQARVYTYLTQVRLLKSTEKSLVEILILTPTEGTKPFSSRDHSLLTTSRLNNRLNSESTAQGWAQPAHECSAPACGG